MINPYTERQRKPLTNAHKNKDNIQLHISPNILAGYNKQSPYQSTKPLTHRPKGKQNKKNRKSIRKDEFPEFAIKFRNQTFESNKINESFTSRTHAQNNMEQSFGRVNPKYESKQVKKYDSTLDQQKNRQPAFQNPPQSNKKASDNNAYLPRFCQALQKIFKNLDVFNRGRISETNINKWIPESALYFLGGVFQKIKQQRLTLSYGQFQALCKPLLKQSAEDDIKWFIEQVSGREVQLNMSIDMPTEQKCRESSPVIMKINNNYVNHYIEKPKQIVDRSGSNRKEVINRSPQPIEFDQVINNIKFKEKELNIRLNNMKQKHQNNPSTQAKVTNQFSFHNNLHKNPQPNAPKNEPSQFAHIKIESSGQKAKRPDFNYDYHLKNKQKILDSVPNFTFQLPKQSEEAKRSQRNIFREIEKNNQIFDANNSSVPKTSRIVRQSIPKEIINSCSKRTSMNAQQTDRLDKLSTKLEQYIKFNKQKLQQNKRFIKENSTPRK